ncbi:acyl-CoA dehydrogenase family protein [Camelimonas sp. ID_303_24]
MSQFLRANYDFGRRRAILAEGGFSPPVWSAFASDMAILGAAAPEADGGVANAIIVMEELGKALVLEPYLETAVIGVGLLRRHDAPLARQLLAGILAGEVRTALAAWDASTRHALEDVATTARRSGDGWVIDGRKSVVMGAPTATHLLVSARTSGGQRDRDGISLFVVGRDAPGVAAHDYRLIDGRGASDIVLEQAHVPAEALLGDAGAALPVLEAVMDEAIAALCAEAVGVMRRMLDDTVAYTRQRRQFGQALADFQGLQHRMVEMFMELEQSAAAVQILAASLDASATERARAASAAKATIARSARFIGQNAVQLHGGMGMTEELPLGHYFRRATVIENQFGSRDYHIARYARLGRDVAGA